MNGRKRRRKRWRLITASAFAAASIGTIAIDTHWKSKGKLNTEDHHGSSRKEEKNEMIRKLKSGDYRLYSRKKDPKTGRRRNLGTFKSRAAAEKHERAVQYFKHH
jgi:mRNA-degrading endonuclease RelE of RelBE toxin-antitoxin system